MNFINQPINSYKFTHQYTIKITQWLAPHPPATKLASIRLPVFIRWRRLTGLHGCLLCNRNWRSQTNNRECPDNLALYHVYTVYTSLYPGYPWLYHCLIGGYWGKVSQRFHMIWDFNIEKALLEHCLWLQVNWFDFDKTELFTAIQDILLSSLYILLSSLWAEFRIWSWIKVTLSRRISIFENIRTLFLENLLYLIV